MADKLTSQNKNLVKNSYFYPGIESEVNIMKKKFLATILALALALSLAACGSSKEENSQTNETSNTAVENSNENTQNTENTNVIVKTDEVVATANVTSTGAIDASDLFSKRDLTQTSDTENATYYTLKDGEDINITAAGVYVFSGNASEVTITVNAGDEDKVQLVLNGANITNSDFPCIYVKSADKVFVTTIDGTENTLTVSGTFTADGDTNTDAVIFSRDDLVLNGLGTLNISSTDNGVSCKDDLKVTGGTINITAADCALEANDSVAIADGVLTLKATNDGIHAENDDDNSVGYVYICGGTVNINAADDGIHATTIFQIDGGNVNVNAAEGIEATWVQINNGNVNVTATDDGVNASAKSSAYTILFEMNDGTLTVKMGAGDTDAIDSNGNIIVNGGTIDITGQSSFDYDGTAQYNGGTIIVNGNQTNSISNQFMGGGMGGMQGFPGGNQGGGQGYPGNNPGSMPGNTGSFPGGNMGGNGYDHGPRH